MRTALLLGLTALVAAAPAAASRVHLAVLPATVSPGAAIRVVGNAGTCHVGDQVAAISSAFPGHQFGKGALYGRVVAGGGFTIHGHVRSGLHAGRYVVTARCGGGNLGVAAHVRVR